MAPTRYTPVPNSRTDEDAERELDDAFESDEEEETTPLQRTRPESTTPRPGPGVSGQGSYDFQRADYDIPPPGSPPPPSARALPNDIGNTNGVLGSEPARPAPPQQSIFRRAAGALLPQHYTPIPTEVTHGTIGGGMINGVFGNVVAKPGRPAQPRGEDGNVHMAPEETQRELPPSYADAQRDAAPPYWETSVTGFDPSVDMIVDDLPTGTFITFASNIFISFFFQFVGFLMTYLMHTTHAAKYGSRVGLGLTMIQYGYYSRMPDNTPRMDETQPWNNGTLAWPSEGVGAAAINSTLPDGYPTDLTPEQAARWASSREWISFIMMTIGWFLILTSGLGFWRVKRWEKSIRSAANPAPVTQVDVEREMHLRQSVARAFFLDVSEDHSEAPSRTARTEHSEANETAEERLARNLRAAGLI